MPVGPGKYDELATYVCKKAKARGVALIVFDGERGNGFSVQATAADLLTLPTMLRVMADEIERGAVEDIGGRA